MYSASTTSNTTRLTGKSYSVCTQKLSVQSSGGDKREVGGGERVLELECLFYRTGQPWDERGGERNGTT